MNINEQLQRENELLQRLATHDELTGILNRRAAEEAVEEALPDGGALFICDLNYFKAVNDSYGHLAGDRCLKKTAELLSASMRFNDIVGRIGGDEFIIFAKGKQTPETVAVIEAKIQKYFRDYNMDADIPLSIGIGYAIVREDDNYQILFERADKFLMIHKREVHSRDGEKGDGADAWMFDLTQIKESLSEEIHYPIGSYCQDFESFKAIFRFMERAMQRKEWKCCLVLFSLTGDEENEVSPEQRRIFMAVLEDVLLRGLRGGDVYTRYSGNQYLVLLNDVTEDLAILVSNRIRDIFYKKIGVEDSGKLLMYYCYQLEAVKPLMD